jgi:hypothetical protein
MCEQAKHSSEAYYLASEELYHSQMVTEFESSVLKEIYFSLHIRDGSCRGTSEGNSIEKIL